MRLGSSADPYLLHYIILLSFPLHSDYGTFVHGYLILFVSIFRNIFKSLWWPRRGARSFKGRNLDPYATFVSFYKSKAEFRF